MELSKVSIRICGIALLCCRSPTAAAAKIAQSESNRARIHTIQIMSAAHIIRHKVAGYEAFVAFIAKLQPTVGEQPINVYFSGTKDAQGNSWCPDCVVAEPVVLAALERIAEPAHFVYVDVGDRSFWKDPKNAFRTDKSTHLSVIPTLLRWRQPQRLEGDHLLNPELLDMFFNDD